VEGGYKREVADLMRSAEQRLRKILRNLGALLLPLSFTVGAPGVDIHYACSLPMRMRPDYGETDSFGKLYGLDGIYVADGASLSSHTEKSHTLTIMGNADRIDRQLAREFTLKDKR
jgi:hypothetical protein